MKKILTTAVILAAVALGGTACDTGQSGTHADKVVAQQKQEKKQEKKDDKSPAADNSPAPKPTPHYTTNQEQAIGAAADYLDYAAFSRSGLIEQLEFEDYSTKDATFAVEHIKVNWMKQAAASAAEYLDYDSFSRGGMIEQLEFEGFTAAQAAHGATSVGLK